MIAFSLILGDVVSGDNILILVYRLFEIAVRMKFIDIGPAVMPAS